MVAETNKQMLQSKQLLGASLCPKWKQSAAEIFQLHHSRYS